VLGKSAIKVIATITVLGCGLVLGLTQCSSVEQLTGGASSEGPSPNRYGSYLAGRFAASERDASSAAHYFDNALKFDPQNPELLERAILSDVSRGDIDSAASYAEDLVKRAPSTRIPHLVIAVRATRDGGHAKARKSFERVAGNAAAEISAKLGIAYSHFAEGNLAGAKEAIGKLVSLGGTRAFGLYHQAVIEDLSGKPVEALADFEEANRLSQGDSLRILQAYAGHLARQGQLALARDTYRDFLKKAPAHPVVRKALARLDAGEIPQRMISNANQGMAETLYGIASSLSEENSFEIPVFYLQLALALDPAHDLSLSLLGDRLEAAERWEDAIIVYQKIPATSPLYQNARQQIAQNLQRLKRPDDALKVLNEALTNSDDDVDTYASIADVLRSQEKYAEAAVIYTKAIVLIGKPEERHWTLFYTRGISYERSKRWNDAEADLNRALVLKPEQPLVMNYLAYSWVEQGLNITQALAMLKRAVDLRPEDGFIVDSLGWAHFRLGDFKSASQYLEQAVLLEPGQATINDHLGDAYWRMGRKLEARFQWQRALTLGAEDGDEPKIRNKLQAGLEELPRAPSLASSPQGGK
jgi:tetratricopeptide (TPR) repeat protein